MGAGAAGLWLAFAFSEGGMFSARSGDNVLFKIKLKLKRAAREAVSV